MPTPEDLVKQAAKWEMPAIALTDHNGLYGIPRFWKASQKAGIKAIIGCEVTLDNKCGHLTLLAENQIGYSNLCRLITLSHHKSKKGEALLQENTLIENSAGLIALSGCRKSSITQSLISRDYQAAIHTASRYSEIFGQDCFFLEMQNHHERNDYYINAQIANLSNKLNLPLVATGNVHYLTSEDAPLHDVLTCIRHRLPLEHAINYLRTNHEYYFHSPQQMKKLFNEYTQSINNTLYISERCQVNLPFGPQVLPQIQLSSQMNSDDRLSKLCHTTLAQKIVSDKNKYILTLDHELSMISEYNLANYFLVVWDLICFARKNNILCQGRGSAANSLVAYLLGITPIDPLNTGLVFERFLSRERSTTPDIDIDFAADRREEVIQYIYNKYGPEQVSMACTIVTFRARSALRDVGLALGFEKDTLQNATAVLDDHSASSLPESKSIRAILKEDFYSPRWQELLRIAALLEGFPRHLGIHNGGMIVSKQKLTDYMPIEPASMPERTVVQWDKDSLELMSWIKLDVLGLRMLSAISDSCALINPSPELEKLRLDDPDVFDMICRGETIGVFQIESRAQSSLIPRFKPRSLAALTIQVALIRPGPLQSNMVHPYLLRREGRNPTTYLHPLLKLALKETLGVILFQEQVLKIARDLAGFTPGEGELLRRALRHKHTKEQIKHFHTRFIDGAQSRGVSTFIANQIFDQLKSFGGYSFSKAHAAAFAVITYWSAWIRCHHPTEFFIGVLRNQPMGFYPEHVVISDARRIGVRFLPVDLRYSKARSTLQSGKIRLGLKTIRGFGTEHINLLLQERKLAPFQSLPNLIQRMKFPRPLMESIVLSGALDYLHPKKHRRQILWELTDAYQTTSRLNDLKLTISREQVVLKPMTPEQKFASEFNATQVSIDNHPTYLYRDALSHHKTTLVSQLHSMNNGQKVKVGGIVVTRQSPPTANGIRFLALEDSSGLINVVIHANTYNSYRIEYHSNFVVVQGSLQIKHGALNLIATHIISL